MLDSHGFIVTGPDLSGHARTTPAWEKLGRDPYLLETSLPGLSQPATSAAARSNA